MPSCRWWSSWLLVVPLVAQNTAPARTLADVQRAFAEQRGRLFAGESLPSKDKELALLREQQKELAEFVAREASGDDRWNGRLMLADLSLGLRDRDGAKQALRAIDATVAPPYLLMTAADMAMRLQDKPLRDQLVEQALARPAPLPERLAMARLLMTLLREVERGEKIFADALAAATDDEARALVRWHHCDAVRMREDLPENSYFEALDKLAQELPKTYYGSVAADRSRASQFKIGGEALPFVAQTTDGTKVELAALRGKAVLLLFWSATDASSKDLAAAIAALRKQHGDDLFVLGVGLDQDPAAYSRACTGHGATFPHVCDGRGWQADLALRYFVEAAPTLIAIDRKGRIAGLNLHIDTKDAREELQAAVERALLRGE